MVNLITAPPPQLFFLIRATLKIRRYKIHSNVLSVILKKRQRKLKILTPLGLFLYSQIDHSTYQTHPDVRDDPYVHPKFQHTAPGFPPLLATSSFHKRSPASRIQVTHFISMHLDSLSYNNYPKQTLNPTGNAFSPFLS